MPRNKKTDTVVVRPIHRGTGIPRKRVLAPLKELNQHLPLVSSPPYAPHIPTRPLPDVIPLPPLVLPPLPYMPLLSLPPTGPLANAITVDPALQKTLAPALVAPPAKPWKQPKSVPRIYRQLRSPPGHTCTPTMGAEWDEARGAYDMDVQEEWEREWAGQSQHDADEEDGRGRVEVHILDIARPAKPRGEGLLCRMRGERGIDDGLLPFPGPAKEFEVVETVRRVIALEDDDDGWEEWDIGSEDELEFDEWEAVEDEKHRLASYAMVLQQSPG